MNRIIHDVTYIDKTKEKTHNQYDGCEFLFLYQECSGGG